MERDPPVTMATFPERGRVDILFKLELSGRVRVEKGAWAATYSVQESQLKYWAVARSSGWVERGRLADSAATNSVTPLMKLIISIKKSHAFSGCSSQCVHKD